METRFSAESPVLDRFCIGTGRGGAAVGLSGSVDAELPDRLPFFGLLVQDGENLGGDLGKRP